MNDVLGRELHIGDAVAAAVETRRNDIAVFHVDHFGERTVIMREGILWDGTVVDPYKGRGRRVIRYPEQCVILEGK